MLLSKHSSEIQSLQKQWHENVHKETMSLRRELEDEMKRKIDNIRNKIDYLALYNNKIKKD